MRHGSLFSGIGGFDLASEWMGWENVFHCEWDSFCQKVLKYYWPKSESYGDITKTDFTIWRGRIDILTGGFPCQPYSQAGKRLGKEDDRHLWPEMLRAIREIQPRWVVGENVHGIVNWSGGLVFEEVQTDLENEGYEVQPYILPAAGVNAPHRRDRVFFVAYATGNGHKSGHKETRGTERCSEQRGLQQLEGVGCERTPPDTDNNGCKRIHSEHEKHSSKRGVNALYDVEQITPPDTEHKRLEGHNEWHRRSINRGDEGIQFGTEDKQSTPDATCTGCETKRKQSKPTTQSERIKYSSSRWNRFPAEPPICDRNDGISDKLVGITFPKWRNESIKAMGNAVVPQVVFEIFKAIDSYEHLLQK